MVHRFTRIPSKLATIVITFNAGSRSEGDGEGREYSSGIAHMLEHCIFTGTKNLTSVDINRKLAYYGASVNAWTSHEAVAYYATAPVDNIHNVVSILSEMVFESTLPEDEFLREKEVVKEEEVMRGEGVSGHLSKIFSENFYTNYLSSEVVGTQESISGFTRDEMESFYRKFIVRENAVVSLCSSQTKSEAKEMLTKFFGKQNGKISRKTKYDISDYKPGQIIETTKEGVDSTHVISAFPDRMACGKSQPVNALLTSILSRGLDSRLYEEIRSNRGLVYGISASSDNNQTGGCILFDFSTRDKNVEEAVAALNSELVKISTELVTDEELQRAKNKFKTSFYGMNESSSSIASNAASQVLSGDISTQEVMNLINNATKEDVLKKASELFKFGDALTIICRKA
jgi:predicted Zn-dependent peptidase